MYAGSRGTLFSKTKFRLNRHTFVQLVKLKQEKNNKMREIIKSLKPHPVVILALALLVVGLLAYTASIKKEVEFRFLDYITFKASD